MRTWRENHNFSFADCHELRRFCFLFLSRCSSLLLWNNCAHVCLVWSNVLPAISYLTTANQVKQRKKRRERNWWKWITTIDRYIIGGRQSIGIYVRKPIFRNPKAHTNTLTQSNNYHYRYFTNYSKRQLYTGNAIVYDIGLRRARECVCVYTVYNVHVNGLNIHSYIN